MAAIHRSNALPTAVAFVLAGASWMNAGCGMLIGVDPGSPEEGGSGVFAQLDGSPVDDGVDDGDEAASTQATGDDSTAARPDDPAGNQDGAAAKAPFAPARGEGGGASGGAAPSDAAAGSARLDAASVDAGAVRDAGGLPDAVGAPGGPPAVTDAGRGLPPGPDAAPPHGHRGGGDGDSSQGVRS